MDNIIDGNIKDFYKTANDIYYNTLDIYTLVTYRVSELIDDYGWIFSKTKSSNIFQLNNFSKAPLLYPFPFIKDMVEVNISKILNSNTGVFKKFQNVIADIGGIFSCFIIIGRILVYSYNKRNFEIQLINRLYKLDNNNDFEIDKIKNKSFLFDKNQINDPLKNNFLNNKNIKNEEWMFKDENNDSNDSINKKYENKTILHELPFLKRNRKLNDNVFSEKKIKEKETIKEINSNIKLNKEDVQKIFDRLQKNDNEIKNMMETKNVKKNNQKIKSDLDEFLKNRKKNKHNLKILKFSTYNLIVSIICVKKLKSNKLREKENIFYIGKDKVNGYLNIYKLMKFYENFEKLKLIIFNEFQIKSFNFMKKRTLNEIQNKTDSNLFDLFNYFNNNKENSINRELDQKFYHLLDNDVKKILHK